MNLVEIDIIHLEAAQRILTRLNDMLAAEAATVGSGTHGAVHFCRHHNIITRRHLAEPATGNLFADARRVDIGGIKEVDSGFESEGEMVSCFISADRPFAPFAVAVAHTAETDTGDCDAGIT